MKYVRWTAQSTYSPRARTPHNLSRYEHNIKKSVWKPIIDISLIKEFKYVNFNFHVFIFSHYCELDKKIEIAYLSSYSYFWSANISRIFLSHFRVLFCLAFFLSFHQETLILVLVLILLQILVLISAIIVTVIWAIRWVAEMVMYR